MIGLPVRKFALAFYMLIILIIGIMIGQHTRQSWDDVYISCTNFGPERVEHVERQGDVYVVTDGDFTGRYPVPNCSVELIGG